MRLNQRTHLSTVTSHQHEFCIQRSPAATESQNKLFTPSSFLLFQRKSSIFLICKVLALVPFGYENVLPAKPPPEGLGTRPHGFTGVQQGNKHRNTDDQTRRKQTCRYFPRIELLGWWLKCYCPRRKCWPKTAEISPILEGKKHKFSFHWYQIEPHPHFHSPPTSQLVSNQFFSIFSPPVKHLGCHHQVKDAQHFRARTLDGVLQKTQFAWISLCRVASRQLLHGKRSALQR